MPSRLTLPIFGEIKNNSLTSPSRICVYGLSAYRFMFGPSSSLANVCLRCQRRLARRAIQWRSTNKTQSPQISVRSQSTAAAHVDDDQYGDHESTGPPNADVKQSEDQIAEGDATFSQGGFNRSRPSSTFYRKWIPHPSALLGMEALGKPAEVLLLPSRDRRILQVPDASDQDRSGNLHEALTSEGQPLSWTQLKHNIEQAKEGFQPHSSIIQIEQYKSLSQRLRSGYTTNQLAKYYREAAVQNPKVHRRLPNNDNVSKKTLIECIVRDVWGFKMPLSNSSGRSPVTDGPKQELQRVRFPKHEGVYNMLFNQTKYRNLLRGIALAHGVDIDFVPGKLWIDIKGEKEGVGKARKEVIDLKMSFKSATLPLPSSVANAFSRLSDDQKPDLLREISSKLGTPLELNSGGKVEVTCSQDNNSILKLLEREFRLALGAVPPLKDNFSIWAPPDMVTGSQLIPVQPVSQLSWSSTRRSWNRLCAANRLESYPGSAQLNSSQRQQYEDLSKQTADLLQIASTAQLFHPRRTQGGLRNEYSASFGTALVGDHTHSTAIMRKREIAKMPFFTFAPNVPMLPQFVETLRSFDTTIQSTEFVKLLLSGSVTRLVYRPLMPSDDFHHYEMYLVSREQKDDSVLQTQVLRVTAVYREKSHCLLLPDMTVDIKFTQQLKQDLFLPGESVPTIIFPQILQALATHASTVQNRPEDEIEPMVTFPIPKAVPWLKKSTATQAKEKNDKESEVRQISFLLASVEKVTSEAYQTPRKTRYPLEYTTYDGGKWGLSRDELRMSETPLLSPSREDEIKFHHFFNYAVGVAEKLHNTAAVMLGGRYRPKT